MWLITSPENVNKLKFFILLGECRLHKLAITRLTNQRPFNLNIIRE